MNKTVLIVEDDVDLLRIYKEILDMEGFETHTAENGQEGIEKFKQTNPALTIMDGEMPIMNGYEAFKQIKIINKDANVVIVTGFSEFEVKNQDAIKAGLIKVISKPVGLQQVIDLAQKYTEVEIK